MKFIFSSYKKALFIAFVVLFIIPQCVFAQREKPKNLSMYDQQPYHFGFIIAGGEVWLTNTHEKKGANYFAKYGMFTTGIVGNLRLGKCFDLRLIPSLSLGVPRIGIDDDDEWKTCFLEFPLHIKYKSKRYNNFAAYIIGGSNLKLDIPSHNHFIGKDEKVKKLIKWYDVAAEIGVGVDFYTYFFKFGIEAKWSFGLIDISKDSDNLHNRMFQLSLTFE